MVKTRPVHSRIEISSLPLSRPARADKARHWLELDSHSRAPEQKERNLSSKEHSKNSMTKGAKGGLRETKESGKIEGKEGSGPGGAKRGVRSGTQN